MEFNTTQSFVKALEGVRDSGVLEDPLLSDIKEMIQMAYEDEGKRKILNYYRIRVKCAIFDKMLDLSKFNFGCINFDKEKFLEENGFEVSWTSTKLLYSLSNEAVCPYFMVGIKQEKGIEKQDQSTIEEPEEIVNSKKNEKFIVESLMAPYQPKQFFINQEVVIPTQILTNDGDLFHRLLNPISHVEKEYLARVEGRAGKEELAKLDNTNELFDTIYLSNIPEFMSVEKIEELFDVELMPLLKDNGTIAYCNQATSLPTLMMDTEHLNDLKEYCRKKRSILDKYLMIKQLVNSVETFRLLVDKYKVDISSLPTACEANGFDLEDTYVYVKKK